MVGGFHNLYKDEKGAHTLAFSPDQMAVIFGEAADELPLFWV